MPTINGTSGRDFLEGTENDDLVSAGEGDDTVFTYGGSDTLFGEGGDDYLVAGEGSDSASGGEGNDLILGLGGNDTLSGDGGDDTIRGDLGNDTITGGLGRDSLNGNEGSDELRGGDDNDFLEGGAGGDTVYGDSGADQLKGGAGSDLLVGGEGDDFFVSGDDFSLDLDADTVLGGGGNDRISAQYGDEVDGGDGLDTLFFNFFAAPVGVSADFARLTAGEVISVGGATIRNMEYVNGAILGAFDDLYIAGRQAPGSEGANISGNGGNDTIVGSSATDLIEGGDGDDVLTGGLGKSPLSTAKVDRIFGGAGNDTIFIQADGAFVSAGPGRDRVTGGPGEDDIRGDMEADTLSGGGGRDFVLGGEGDDLVNGGEGDDWIDGGQGVDTMEGGPGDDMFVVDAVGDRIVELAADGIDVVEVRARNFLLNAGAEIEVLRAEFGTDPINIGGNEFSQRIEGNAGNNILSSGGGGGVDTMAGGLGDDVYRVFATGDVIEDIGGFDTVFASGTSYFLFSTAAVEYLSASEQAGTTPIYLVGNGASQVIAGNYGDNILNGRGGDARLLPDTLIGLRGDDTYAVFSQGDVVREVAGEGTEVVYASTSYQLRTGTEIEALAAINGAATDAYALRGNAFAQTVVGNAGANTLDGRGGNDTLVGLAGADTFAFTTAPASANVDTIQDFASEDRIGLASDVFAAVAAGGIEAGEFLLGTTAQDADDRLLYDQATGRLFYDADANGAGAVVLFAQLAPGTVLTAASFVTVAPVSDLPGA